VLAFSLHPLRVEVTAWASGQPYALAGAAAAAALHCHARALAQQQQQPRAAAAAAAAAAARWRAAAAALYAAAAFSKAAAAPMAAAHLALEAWHGGGSATAAGPRVVFLGAIAAAALCAVAGAAYGNASHVEVSLPRHNEGAGLAPRQRAAAAAAAAAAAGARALTLRGLAPRYPLPLSLSPLDAAHAPPLAAAAALAAAGLACLARRLPRWRAAFAAFAASPPSPPSPPPPPPPPPCFWPSFYTLLLLALFPTSGLIKHGYDSAGADRYS
jgi:hypothetical protein